MGEIKKSRLKGDWQKIGHDFYAEFTKILQKEQMDIYKALGVESNDRDKDMFSKGRLHELNVIHTRLATLVKSIGENLG